MVKEKYAKGEMPAREMGRKGGNTTKARYGHEYYVSIGKKGGDKIKKILDAGKKTLSENC